MHGRRAFAAAAAAGLLVSLFAPWYRMTVVARGVTGLRTLTLTQSGWQAFSATELLIVVVAAVALVVLIGMPRAELEAAAPDRMRLSGVVVAVLGAIASVIVLGRLATAPGMTKHALDETMIAIRWGIFLALTCSVALTAAGLRLIRSQRQPARRRTERARPSAAHTDGRTPSAVAPSRRSDRPTRRPDRPTRRPDRPTRRPDRPTRRPEQPLWDEPGSGWVDLPD
jgi:hypothetical protein